MRCCQEKDIKLHGPEGWQAVPLWHRDFLAVGQTLLGPALIVEATGTIVLAQGWSAQVLAANQLGATELQALVQREGIQAVRIAMAQVQALGDAAVRRVIDRLQDGSHRININDGSQWPVKYFGIRRGSGGEGRWRGGDGLIRELRFLEPLTIALISGSRLQAPKSLEGGGLGAAGLNLLIPPYGDPEMLPGCIERQLAAGDRLRTETPGGGGYGAPSGHPLSDAG